MIRSIALALNSAESLIDVPSLIVLAGCWILPAVSWLSLPAGSCSPQHKTQLSRSERSRSWRIFVLVAM